MRRCPNCGAQVDDNSLNCPNCFAELPRSVESQQGWSDPSPRGRKDPTLALILAVIPGIFGLWGIGHLYLGETSRGLMYLVSGIVITLLLYLSYISWFLVITLVCMVILALVWFGGFVLQCWEAYSIARMRS